MVRFILLTFAFLGWGFYELSGGSDFDPQAVRLTNVTVDPLKPAKTVEAIPVVQAEITPVALNLTTVDEVLTSKSRPAANLPQQPRPEPAVLSGDRNTSATILPSLVTGADVPPESEPTPVAVVEVAPVLDIRTVSGSRVNVRGGPGTSFGVVNQMVRGDEVEILEDTGDGWVRLRPADGGPVGWMADFLLTEG